MQIVKYAFIFSLLVLAACTGPQEKTAHPEQGLEELDRAITAIEDRREAEREIVQEQGEIKKQLEENLKEANSQGMREKIEQDILMKETTIRKAKVNLANQDTILKQLYAKKDSLLVIG
jgi:Skp family chaperone for outer membrane proteins